MANSRKGRNVKQFPKAEQPPDESNGTATATMDPPSDPQTPFDAAPPAEQPPPRKTPKTLTFFQRVASIDRSDWGDRAKIKVYRLAPLINRLAGSEHKFITIYGEPITEEKLKVDHGSGRYRLYLNYKNAGQKDEKEVDMVELDILDPSYPPKIPPGEWLDDPRNKNWAWARPANAGQQPQNGQQQQPSVDPLAAFSTFMDIQDRIEDRVKPAEPATAAPVPVDPWSAAEKILNMRSENPMVAILQQQMKDAATAAENERTRAFTAAEAAREREFKLQQQLLEARTSQGQSKSLADQVLELLPLVDKLEPVFKRFGFGQAATEVAGRVAKTTAYDIARDIFTSPFGQEVGAGLGSLLRDLAARGTPPNPNPAQPRPPIVLNQQNSNGTAPPAEDLETRINRIGQIITQPMLYEFFLKDEPGSAFAATMFDMWPEDYAFMRGLGAENIVARYRRFGPAWALIAPKEPAFIEFIQEFCKWDPNEDEGPSPPGDGDEGVVDLEAEGGN